MSAHVRARPAAPDLGPRAALAVSAALALAALLAVLAWAPQARAEEAPNVGGTVSSTLELSLGEPTPLRRVSGGGRRGGVYGASVAVEVTATEAPIQLTVADGEAFAGRRRGHMVAGSAVLSAPLRARAGHGPYRSLDASVDPLLQQWGEPISAATATIRLRQATRGSASALGKYHKLLLVTLTAGGP